MTISRADLHVHSKYSDRPTEWILRRIGAPECYTAPETVYDTARRRGMQFVTISDHNCIDGALEIAHLPGAFVSNEITAYFPDDGCKIHVLCWNITEAEFKDIQELRQNIVELRDYLHARGIAHACAHPLYDINARLTIDHFEQLLLLFNVFETMNGGRNRRGNELVRAVLEQLTPEQIDEMANRHGLAPVGDRPWLKRFTGGSDDHSGLFIAKGFTECPAAATPAEFLHHVVQGRSVPGGLDGTPLSFAHSLYGIGYQYYRDRFLSKSVDGRVLLLKMLGDLFARADGPTALGARVSRYARAISGRREKPGEAEFRRMISAEAMSLFGEDWLKDDFVADPDRFEELNRRTFELASRVVNQLIFQFSKKFVEKLWAGSLFGSLEAVSAAGPVVLGAAPYLFSFAHQNRDKAFLADVRDRFLGTRPAQEAPPATAWFADAASGVDRLTPLVHQISDAYGRDLTLVTVADIAPAFPGPARNFAPVGDLALPEHASATFAFPPFLDMLDYCDREQFTELIVSTPSLTGLAAVACGKMLKIRLVGVCDTSLPQWVLSLTEDETMENAAWRYLSWFYEQMDRVYVPSPVYRRQLIARGLDPRKLTLISTGAESDAVA